MSLASKPQLDSENVQRSKITSKFKRLSGAASQLSSCEHNPVTEEKARCQSRLKFRKFDYSSLFRALQKNHGWFEVSRVSLTRPFATSW